MKVVVVASRKGGSGKTTLVGQLSVQAEVAGDGPVAVMDVDPACRRVPCLPVRYRNKKHKTKPRACPAIPVSVPASSLSSGKERLPEPDVGRNRPSRACRRGSRQPRRWVSTSVQPSATRSCRKGRDLARTARCEGRQAEAPAAGNCVGGHGEGTAPWTAA